MRDIHVPAGRRSLPSTSRTYPLRLISSRQVHTPTQCSDFERNLYIYPWAVVVIGLGLLTYGAQAEGDAREDDGRSTELCVHGMWVANGYQLFLARSASSAVLGSLDSAHVGYFTRPCCLVVRWCLCCPLT
jgi:hypothetical protein